MILHDSKSFAPYNLGLQWGEVTYRDVPVEELRAVAARFRARIGEMARESVDNREILVDKPHQSP